MRRRDGAARRVLVFAAAAALACALGGCGSRVATQRIAYVAPDGAGVDCTRTAPCSLTQAQQRVRDLLAQTRGAPSGISVQISDGPYRLAAPLRFAARDSGHPGHPVTWTAAPGAHPVISGGARITGWRETDAAHGIWSASVAPGTRTRDVYVDGKVATRARTLTSGLDLDLSQWDADGFVLSGATATYFSRLAERIGAARVRGLELRWRPMPPTDWEESMCPMAAITPHRIRMAEPCWRNLTTRPATIWGTGNNNVNPYVLKAGAAPTAIVNALPLLTAPGEWYLDGVTHTLYYKPLPGQNMARADVEVPRLQTLLEVAGTLAHPVHDLVFRGLTFTTTTWLQPSSDTGFVQVQANLHITGANNQGECTFTTPPGSCPWGGFDQPPGAVELVAAHRVTLRDSRFVDLGAIGVEVRYGSRDNRIEGNVFTRIASSAVWLGCAGDPDPLDATADPPGAIIALCAADPASTTEDMQLAGSAAEIMTGNTVANNLVHHVGYRYAGAAAITLLFTRGTTIAHNDVFDVPYDGLTSGAWQGHPDNVKTPPTHRDDVTTNINADNAIIGNFFHANMQVFTGDGGNIYTEGHQGRTFRFKDGSIDAAASWAHGLRISGNVFASDPPGNRAYAIAPDVGSQWIDATGNVEWGLKYAFSCHWPTEATSRLRFTGNWRADPDDTHCATDTGNTELPAAPGPDDVPLDVLAHAGLQGRYRALAEAVSPVFDYVGVSPGSSGQPARVLITGSGFTPSARVTIGNVRAPHVRFVSPNVLVVTVPPHVPTSAKVVVTRDKP